MRAAPVVDSVPDHAGPDDALPGPRRGGSEPAHHRHRCLGQCDPGSRTTRRRSRLVRPLAGASSRLGIEPNRRRSFVISSISFRPRPSASTSMTSTFRVCHRRKRWRTSMSNEHAADSARRGALKAAGDERTAEYLLIREAHNLVEDGRPDDVDWIAVAKTQLYRRKRSANLGDTLRALGDFDAADVEDTPPSGARTLWSRGRSSSGGDVLRRIKQQASPKTSWRSSRAERSRPINSSSAGSSSPC